MLNQIRHWINLVKNTDKEQEFYINQANHYRTEERAKWWPVSKELMASYRDGDKPAYIDADGALHWDNGQLHRDEDKPAVIYANGTLGWYKNGLLHRDGDKPAWIGADGALEWCKNGEQHRDGHKPAEIWADGTLEWWKNSRVHRLTGPAVIDSNNKFEWWFKGKKIPVKSQEKFLQWLEKNGHVDVYRLRKS